MRMSSQIAVIARGSVGGDTFTANQYHQIVVRARTAPVQPGTLMQTKIKAAFGTASTEWDALTPAQRTAWDDYADTCVFHGPLGAYKIPGRQIFLSNVGTSLYWTDRAVPGQSVITAAPELAGFASIQNLNVEILPSPGIGYAITGRNNNIHNITVVAMNSIPFNHARNRYKGPFKSDIIWSASVAPANEFEIELTPLVDDRRYFASVRAMTLEDAHRMTPLFYVNAISTTVEA